MAQPIAPLPFNEVSSFTLQKSMELCTLPTFLSNCFGEIVAHNHELAELLRYPHERMSELKTAQIFPAKSLKNTQLPLTIDQIASHIFLPTEVINADNESVALYIRGKAIVLGEQVHYSCSLKPPFFEFNLNPQQEQIESIKILYENYDKSKMLEDMAVELLTLFDPNGIITYVSGSCSSLLGYTQAEMIGKNALDFIAEADQKTWSLTMDKILNQGKDAGILVHSNIHKNGQLVPTESTFRILRDRETKKLTSILCNIRDITARLEQLHLEQAQQEIARMRTATAVLTHDIRNFLVAIDLANKQLLEEDISPEDRRSANMAITAGTNSIGNMCTSYITYYMIIQGKFETKVQPVRIQELANNLLTLFNPIALSRKIRFGIEYLGVVPNTILADETCLQGTILNLVTNAMKFTPEGGRVRLSISGKILAKDTIRLHFAVKDNGPGIAPEIREMLLKRLNSNEPPKSHNPSGLGLWIAQKFVKSMGGEKITIERSSSKGGTTFAFEVLVSKVDKIKDLSLTFVLKNLLAKYDASVLVVDDNKANTLTMNGLLRNLGVSKIKLSNNAAEAVEMVAQEQFDVIMIDWRMPVLDGIGAIKQIVSRKTNLPSGFVICSGSDSTIEALETLKDVDNLRWMLKPYKPIDVYNDVRDFLEQRDQERRMRLKQGSAQPVPSLE